MTIVNEVRQREGPPGVRPRNPGRGRQRRYLSDLGDFRPALFEPFGVEPLRPDDVRDALAVGEPERAAAALAEMAARRPQSPMTPTDLLDPFEVTIPKFVTRCRWLV